MADVLGYSPVDGSPLSVPQEAAAQHYRDGKIAFKKGTPVPVKVDGIEGTLPAEDLDAAMADPSHQTELNFDPNGAAKAAGYGALSGATMGASDWAMIEGSKLLHGPEAGEKTRQSLEGLRNEHGFAWGTAELGAAVIPSLVPGGAEAELLEGGARGAAEVAEASRLAGPATETIAAGQQGLAEANAARQIADSQAASGVTKGSLLARTLRATNPYEYVGKAGEVTGETVARVLGDGRAARIAAPLTRYATEGALLGAANAVDESELGDTNLTGETILANMEHGALWGTGLGLVGTGASRILTGAGRMANRLAEAQLGGTPTAMREALRKHGPGTLGLRDLEEGTAAIFDPEKKYEAVAAVHERDGESLGRAVSDLDKDYTGMSAKEAYNAADQAIGDKIEQYGVVGGDKAGMQALLRKEVRQGLGLQDLPEVPEPIPMTKADEIYEQAAKEAGLPDLKTLKKPRKPSKDLIREETKRLWAEKGLDQPFVVTPDMIAQRFKETVMKTGKYLDGQTIANLIKAERGKLKADLAEQAERTLNDKFLQETKQFNDLNSAHLELQQKAVDEVNDLNSKATAEHHRLTEAYKKYNDELKVGFGQVRDVRIRIDKHIPWHYAHNADAVANMAAELKLGVRSALENKLESEADRVAAATGDSSKLGNYMLAKQRYSQSADMLRMAERARARHAGLFGRTSRVGVGNVIMGEMMGLMTGHPFAGAAIGAGTKLVQHYGPKVAAWALHKASKLAQYKAIRQEILIANRRGIRKALAREAEPVVLREEVRAAPIAAPIKEELTPTKATADKAATPLDKRILVTAKKLDEAVSSGGAENDLHKEILETLPGLPHKGDDVHIADIRDAFGSSEELDKALIQMSREGKISLSADSAPELNPERAKLKRGALWHPGRQENVHYAKLAAAATEDVAGLSNLEIQMRRSKALREGDQAQAAAYTQMLADRVGGKKAAPTGTAKVKIADMSPAEARMTAAEAMGQVARLAGNPAELRSRLAALDPSLPIVAPKSFAAAEGAFRRQVQWMLQQVPPHLLRKYQTEGAINPRDLTATQARDFFDHALGTVEPRAVTDMLAAGNLSANVVAAHKANWPNITKMAMLQYNRNKAMDRDSFDFLTPSRKAQHDMLFGAEDPSLTLHLQTLAANAIATQPPPSGKGKGGQGMTHAAATSKGMAAMVSLEASASQTSESGPPGRRGRSGRSAEAAPGF